MAVCFWLIIKKHLQNKGTMCFKQVLELCWLTVKQADERLLLSRSMFESVIKRHYSLATLGGDWLVSGLRRSLALMSLSSKQICFVFVCGWSCQKKRTWMVWNLFCVCFFFNGSIFVVSGLLCHRDDACISNPCREGSQCDTNPVTGMYNCNCPIGYMGPTCNIDRDECSIGKRGYLQKYQNLSDSLHFLCVYLTFPFIFSLQHQVPIHASTVVIVWIPMAPSSATAGEATRDHAVNRTSMSVLQAPAWTMARAWTASGSTLASACQVWYTTSIYSYCSVTEAASSVTLSPCSHHYISKKKQ